jgi:hypothetical protein
MTFIPACDDLSDADGELQRGRGVVEVFGPFDATTHVMRNTQHPTPKDSHERSRTHTNART